MTCTAASHQGATKEPAATLFRTCEANPGLSKLYALFAGSVLVFCFVCIPLVRLPCVSGGEMKFTSPKAHKNPAKTLTIKII